MRFRICDRMLAALAGLLIILLGLLVGIAGAGLLPVVDLSIVYGPFTIWQRVIIIAAGLLLCLLGLHGLWMLFRRRSDKGFIVQRTDLGDMNIAMSALSSMVNKCVDQHQEISVKKIRIHKVRDGVIVDLKILLANGINIPLTVNVLQKQIKQYITSCSGVDVREVRVQIDTSEMVIAEKPEEPVAAIAHEKAASVALQEEPVVETAAESILRHTEEPADYVEPVEPVAAYETAAVQEEAAVYPAAEEYAAVEETEIPAETVEYAAEEAVYEAAPAAEIETVAETAEEAVQQLEEVSEAVSEEPVMEAVEEAVEDAVEQFQPVEEAAAEFVEQELPVQEAAEAAEEAYTDFFAQPQSEATEEEGDAGLWTQIGDAFVRREGDAGEEARNG